MGQPPRWLPVAFAALLATLVALPHFSVADYSSVQHSTSQLAAQGAPYAWVMRSVFVMLGVGSVLDGWSTLRGYAFQRAALVVFGGSLVGAAVWSHAPIDAALRFDARQDEIHSVFATATGLSFTLFAVSAAFIDPHAVRRVVHAAVGMAASLLSLLFFSVPHLAGVWQRVIFVGCFGWLIYFFRTRRTSRRSL